jgi:threonine synthase
MPCYVFVPDDLERAKILATEVYGAKVVTVKGNYDAVNRLCSEVAEALPWAFVNVNMRPFYAEGSKSLGFETAEQLGWRLPDHVVVPIASGALLTKVHRAFQELTAIGAVEGKPSGLGRAAGGLPPGRAGVPGRRRDRGADEARHDRALVRSGPCRRHVRDAGGARRGHIEWCTEQEIREGMSLLAETEGEITETAGGVTIANSSECAIRHHQARRGDGRHVTGNGYKTIEASRVRGPSYHVALTRRVPRGAQRLRSPVRRFGSHAASVLARADGAAWGGATPRCATGWDPREVVEFLKPSRYRT